MKYCFKRHISFILCLLVIFGTCFFIDQSVFANDKQFNGTDTLILNNNDTNNKDGNGILSLIILVLNILTIGVGILGVLGVAISGVLYITARDDAARMAAAKRRLINVVIGLIIYAVIWTFMELMIPGGLLNFSSSANNSGNTTESTDNPGNTNLENSSGEYDPSEPYAEGSVPNADGTRSVPNQEGWTDEESNPTGS